MYIVVWLTHQTSSSQSPDVSDTNLEMANCKSGKHIFIFVPTTISGRPVCFSISSIFVWNTGSTASTWLLKIYFVRGAVYALTLNANTSSRLRHCKNLLLYLNILLHKKKSLNHTSTQLIVYSSMNWPSINPITSIGTPARPAIVNSLLSYTELTVFKHLQKG